MRNRYLCIKGRKKKITPATEFSNSNVLLTISGEVSSLIEENRTDWINPMFEETDESGFRTII